MEYCCSVAVANLILSSPVCGNVVVAKATSLKEGISLFYIYLMVSQHSHVVLFIHYVSHKLVKESSLLSICLKTTFVFLTDRKAKV